MKTLFLFVEGPDDERFFQHLFGKGKAQYIQYRNNPQKDINNKLRSIKRNPMCDYMFFADADGCEISERVKRIIAKYQDCETDKVCVVQFEIESWYLAGITQEESHKMRIKHFACTDSIKKEQFNAIIPKSYARVDFMVELLKRYDYQEAQSRNTSFRLFYDKWKREQAV